MKKTQKSTETANQRIQRYAKELKLNEILTSVKTDEENEKSEVKHNIVRLDNQVKLSKFILSASKYYDDHKKVMFEGIKGYTKKMFVSDAYGIGHTQFNLYENIGKFDKPIINEYKKQLKDLKIKHSLNELKTFGESLAKIVSLKPDGEKITEQDIEKATDKTKPDSKTTFSYSDKRNPKTISFRITDKELINGSKCSDTEIIASLKSILKEYEAKANKKALPKIELPEVNEADILTFVNSDGILA